MFYKLGVDCQIPGLGDIYSRYLGNTNNGTFVEVGAYDGHEWSNTYCLADMGWRGLYIEPDPSLFERCKGWHKKHSKVSCINTAIGAENGIIQSFYSPKAQLHTADPEFATHFKAVPGLNWEAHTLEYILDAYKIEPGFDLLVIDVEGYEPEVLRGFNIMWWKPHMVIIEAHEQHPVQELGANTDVINAYFDRFDYTKIYSDKYNNIYVKDEIF